eukprot:CAMPEP_0206548246 /NCGR_PEP_ID=MMETSP0325_2-20121206/13772_1 /ASSEMBLY_ACC=CAM_ASM_000347 /TAXON_ID=2866 /ORGANISM="Crypthecodinium cohnii, Strain Seligo" /LENGTH=606 /DNA_ID=CAMNT_0054047695 /DNA_START=9 /DNA_END=1826 /DNA_ORIENTATION=+
MAPSVGQKILPSPRCLQGTALSRKRWSMLGVDPAFSQAHFTSVGGSSSSSKPCAFGSRSVSTTEGPTIHTTTTTSTSTDTDTDTNSSANAASGVAFSPPAERQNGKHLREVLKRLGWQAALHEFYRLGQEDPENVGLHCYNNALAACKRGKLFDGAYALLSEMSRSGIKPDVSSYTTSIGALTSGARWPVAVHLAERALAEVEPNSFLFGAAFVACQQGSLWRNILTLLDDADSRDVALHLKALSSAVSALEKSSQWEAALATASTASGRGLSPDAAMYNSMINAYGRATHWIVALSLLEEMRRKMVKPTTVTFNSLLTASRGAVGGGGGNQDLTESCSSSWEASLAIFAGMNGASVQSDRITYNCLLSTLEKVGDVDLSWQLFQNMQSQKISPDTRTFFSVLTSTFTEVSLWEAALDTFGSIRAAGISPDDISYISAAAACNAGSQWHLSLALWDDLQSQGCQLSEAFVSQVITSCRDSKQWQLALEFCWSALRSGHFHPSESTFGAALNVLEAVGQWRESLELFDRLDNLGLRPNVLIYNLMAGTAQRAGRWQMAVHWLQRLDKDGLQKSSYSYSTALRAASSGRQKRWSQELVREMTGTNLDH